MNSRILLIEDEIALINALEVILQANGFEVEKANCGSEALSILQADNSIDLILCDLNLPDMSGFDILNKVRNTLDLYFLPFIFLTAFADESDVRHGMNMGADDYLTKPFSTKELLKTVNSRLQIKEKKMRMRRHFVDQKWSELLNHSFRQEFYTPLNGIMNASYLLESSAIPLEQSIVKDTISAIYGATFRMHRNTRNLLLYSLLVTGQSLMQEFNMYGRKVCSILEEVLKYYDGDKLQKSVVKKSILAVSAETVDGNLLNILFTEVIDNAYKFNDDAHAAIEISMVSDAPGKFTFTAKNKLKQPTDAFTEKDIEPFRKFHSDMSLNGFGLGLFLSQEISKQLGYDFQISIVGNEFLCTLSN